MFCWAIKTEASQLMAITSIWMLAKFSLQDRDRGAEEFEVRAM